MSEVNERILRVFTGEELNPVLLKVKGTPYKALVDFGLIRIPKSAVVVRNFGELEEEYECVVRDEGLQISILPKVEEPI